MNTLALPTGAPALGLSPEQRAVLLRVAVLGLLGLVLSLASPAFLTAGNLVNVLRHASLMFLLASGLTLVVLCGGLDLSIGANVALSACVSAAVLKTTNSVPLGCAAGAACGLAIGLLNGLMVTALRIPPFIATYGMFWIGHGVTFWFMNGETINSFPAAFRALGSGHLAAVPVPVLLMLGVLLAGTALTQYTPWGQEVYATGANAEAASLSGVPVFQRRLAVYAASGLMAGLASLVYLARLNSADADMGEGLMLQAIAAVLIGGVSLFGGSGTLLGTLAGALILTLVLNGMNLSSVSANWQPLITGAIVILAVLSDALARKRRGG